MKKLSDRIARWLSPELAAKADERDHLQSMIRNHLGDLEATAARTVKAEAELEMLKQICCEDCRRAIDGRV